MKPRMTKAISMPNLLLVGSVWVVVFHGAAHAQSGERPEKRELSADVARADGVRSSDQERIAEYLAQCLKDWDTATHMTKKEWVGVCRRVGCRK
jgi:hypothetical protein